MSSDRLRHTADILERELHQTTLTLGEIVQHREFLGEAHSDSLEAAIHDVTQRLNRRELIVAVVGEKKSGKSSFLNAILGRRVLGTAVREFTGVTTFIRKGPELTYTAHLQAGTTLRFVNQEHEEQQRLHKLIQQLQRKLRNTQTLDLPEPGELEDKKTELQSVFTKQKHTVDRLTSQLAELRRKEHDLDREYTNQRDALNELHEELKTLSSRRKALAERSSDLENQRRILHEAKEEFTNQFGDELRRYRDSPTTDVKEQRKAAEIHLTNTQMKIPTLLRNTLSPTFLTTFLHFLYNLLFPARLEALRLAQIRYQYSVHLDELQTVDAEIECITRELTTLSEAISTNTQAEQNKARQSDTQKERRDELRAHIQQRSRLLYKEQEVFDKISLDKYTLDLALSNRRGFEQFQREVTELTDTEKRGPEVLELHIESPSTLIPDDVVIVDTPGVNTDNTVNQQRAWNVVKNEADGCLLVTDLQQVVSDTTREFLEEIQPIIPHVLLVMTKVDRAYENAELSTDPWADVQEAKDVGIQRFATQVNRDPSEVFSIAVAAETVLTEKTRYPELKERFRTEVEKIFKLLESERSVVLSARALTTLDKSIENIHHTSKTAEEKYRRTISKLEQQRLPNPDAFHAEQMNRIRQDLGAHSQDIAEFSIESARADWSNLIQSSVRSVESQTSKAGVTAFCEDLEIAVPSWLQNIMNGLEAIAQRSLEDKVKDIQQPLLTELRARYHIVDALIGRRATNTYGGHTSSTIQSSNSIASLTFSKLVSDYEGEQFLIGTGGAITGAVIGSFILPGIGTVLGGLLGASAGFLVPLSILQDKVIHQLYELESQFNNNLEAQTPALTSHIENALDKELSQILHDEILKFQEHIDQVLAQELEIIDSMQNALTHLRKHVKLLDSHRESLTLLRREVALLSKGLCRN